MTADPIAALWDRLLSREPDTIRLAFKELDDSSQRSVLAHLRRMATEEGWHPQQRASAQAALDVIQPVARRRKRH